MKFITKTLTPFICFSFALILFAGCKKEKRSAAQWGELAVAKRNEI